MTTIKAYRVTLATAYAAYEQGSQWLAFQVPPDTDHYKHEYKEITVSIPEGAEVLESNSGDMLLYLPSDEGWIGGYTLDDAVQQGIAKL